ncbi:MULTISPECIES: hypothetical protein [unclassified Rathayibacter]|uniref:hypothetical protein n=1 Tax=unclassified Rathayibacter TaxID=2609250 RepID=UPI00188CA0E4|nr:MULTISPECIES: hypothetical protein [unclassified Rathayibacter]MBF4462834.1 hypothetical protein [Rathayibacter sp. VKM Ac-2879]MBF4504248.1 hypothetical protein [Rathayibacter sp. VKM Ac-2878]
MTPQECRETSVDLVVATRELLECREARAAEVFSTNGAGSAIAFDLWAPPDDERAAACLRVARYWTSLGLTVDVFGGPSRPCVRGTGDTILRAIFDTGSLADLYALSVTVRCPGGGTAPRLDDGALLGE